MAHGIVEVARTDITPTKNATFQDVDVTAYVAAGSVGVVLEIENTGTAAAWTVRKNGSTDNYYHNLKASGRTYCGIGIDAGDIFEAKIATGASIAIYIVGYVPSGGGEFLDNCVDIGITASGDVNTWLDYDLTGDTVSGVAKVAFMFQDNLYAASTLGVRENGSTDNRVLPPSPYNQYMGLMMATDAGEILERYMNVYHAAFKLYYIGCIYTGYAGSQVNAVEYSLSTTGAWTDSTMSDAVAGSGGVFVQLYNSNASADVHGLRKNGDTYTNLTSLPRCQQHAWCAIDASKVLEQYIDNALYNDLWLWGWTIDGAAPSVGQPYISRVQGVQGMRSWSY